jgi:hypothetical protein
MKKNFLLILTAVCLQCCAPATYITGSWKSPAPVSPYKNIFIAALTENTIAKATLENSMSDAFGKQVITEKSIDEFPPGLSNNDTSHAVIIEKIKNKNADAILTISILGKETETRYVPGSRAYDPLGYPYYNDFWGYYDYWYPSFYNRGYYEQNKVYFIETNLYDTESKKLIWSAQSKTYSPDELQPFAKEFAEVIVEKLRSDKIIPQAVKEKKSNDPAGY